MIEITGNQISVRFERFRLEEYATFIKTKAFPESTTVYDWRTDSYTVTAPARFAHLLGVATPARVRAALPLSPWLFDYQRFIVKQALAAQRYAIYADCGLGKTNMFLEYLRHVRHRTGGPRLILSPGEVIPQTIEEAARFYGEGGYPIRWIDDRDDLIDWLKACRDECAITNYEKFIPGQIPEMRNLAGLAADESSILKTQGGTIKWNLMKSTYGIEYKLSNSATPAPNDTFEYLSQAGFLDKFSDGTGSGAKLASFYTRDKAGNWKLKPHAVEGYYRFLASWSIYLRNPAVYGFRDNVEPVPAPTLIEHDIPMTNAQAALWREINARDGRGLFGDQRMGVTARNAFSQIAKGFRYVEGGRDVVRIRSDKPATVARIAAEEMAAGRQTLIWTVFDEESAILARRIKHAEVLTGSMSHADRYQVREAFRKGEIPALISKARLLGFGLNFQNCKAMIFSGWNDSYEQWYQAVRRAVRYGQTDSVRVHVPFIRELEGAQLNNLRAKQAAFERDADLQERFYREALGRLAA